VRKSPKVLLSKNDIINLSTDTGTIKLYYKVMKIRKKTGWGAWKISKFLKNWSRRQSINQWINGYEKPKSIKEIEKLKRMGLVPLIVSSKDSFRLFIRIFGFRLADGCIYFQRRNNSFTFALYFGTLKDAQWLCNDVNKIWQLNVKPNKFKNSNEYVVYLPSFLARLYISLGSPVGDKTSQMLKLPQWIPNLPNNLKWEFIDGLFAGDGTTPRLKPNINSSESLRITLNSEKTIVEVFRENFMKKLQLLLNSLSIKTSEPKIIWKRKILSKDGTVTYPVELRILTQKENMIKFLENVNYTYCKKGNIQREKVLNGLKGNDIKDELFLFFETNGEIPPFKNICILLEKNIQFNLIENAASRFPSKNRYTQLAMYLYKKFRNLSQTKFSSLRDNYIFDWKFGRRFIPYFYLKELAFLSGIKLNTLFEFVQKVRLFKNRNKFAFPVDKVIS